MLESVTVVPEPFVLSSLPPSRAEKRLALAVVVAMLVTFIVASGPLSHIEPPRVVAFVPAYTTLLVFSDLITAILLFSQFSIFRTRALLVISSGYLFTALMPIPWMLMFPGVFVADGFLIGGLQSRAYFYFFWYAGFPIFVMSYVLLKDADPSRRYWRGTTSAAIALSVALTAVAVAALALFFALGDSILPHVEADALRFSSLWREFAVPMVSLIALALVMLWIRWRSILDLWLMVVMCASVLEIWLSYFPVATVYGFGWYVSRIFGLLSASLVLFVLLFEITIDNWWRQGMMGGAKAHYDCIKAFSETDFTEDLKKITVPTLVMHGDDDQVVPIEDSALLAARLVRNATLKIYQGYPHGMCTTHADTINEDLLAFIRV